MSPWVSVLGTSTATTYSTYFFGDGGAAGVGAFGGAAAAGAGGGAG
jgi:hypothetical protein